MVLNELSTNHILDAVDDGTCYITDVRIYVEHPRLTDRAYTLLQWDELVKTVFHERGISKGRLATDSPSAFGRLRNVLPDVQPNASAILRELRFVKCEEELAIMRAAAELTDWGQEKYRELLAVGEIPFNIQYRAMSLMAEEGIKRFPDSRLEVRVSSVSGPGTACPHRGHRNFGRKIAWGDVMLDIISIKLNGYSVENERTFIFGEPSREQARLFNLHSEAQAAGIEKLVEGVRICDFDATCQAIIERAGYGHLIYHRSGHGIGLGGHEWPDDTAFNMRLFKANAVMSCEPALFVRGVAGYRHSDTIVVGKDKPEVLTKFTKRLEDLTIMR
jgi:Xaa-Pro aminopeptidase